MQKKLLFSYIVLAFLAIGLSLSAFWSQGYGFMEGQSEAYYLSQTNMLGDIFEEEEFYSIEDYAKFANYYGDKYKIRVTIIDIDGEVYADSEAEETSSFPELEDHSKREEVLKALKGESSIVRRYSNTMGKPYSYSAVPVTNGDFSGVIRLSVPLEEFVSLYSGLRLSVIYAIVICGAVAIILAYVFAKRIADPINQVATAADRISKGELDVKIYTREKDEVGELARGFNVMAKNLKETIQSLTKRNVELEAMLTSMNSGIVAINDENEILFYNKALLGFTEKKEKDLKGVTLYSVIRSQTVILTIEEVRDELVSVVKEGYEGVSDKQIRVIGCPLVGEDGESFGVLLVLEDITKIKKLEKMRSDFVSNVTHELKTPLTSIRGFIETLKNGAINDEKTANRFLDIIDIEAERLFELIKDILLLSEIESRVPKETVSCDMNEVITSVMELLEPKLPEGVEFVFDGKPLVREFYCNPDRMKQMFINLLDNAIRYTEKGSIHLSLSETPYQLEIRVKDTGIGIEEEHIERIFERFYRVDRGRSRKNGGTGLGLSIVKHIVELYSGKIRVESTFGVGTEIIIQFPYRKI